MRYVVAVLVCVAALVTSHGVQADEGMWLLSQLQGLDLKEKGFEITAEEIFDPDGPALVQAVVNLGASAELVSPEGLLLTNHHVAYFGVMRASTRGSNYLVDGYLARSRDEEIAAPGYTARILQRMEDVTGQVLDGIEQDNPAERERAIAVRIRTMTDALEQGHNDVDAEIVPMYAGRQYMLFVHQRFDDVRLVYVPPAAIGNYGGDVDNWMWPRHTGDFSFLRVYMAPDGSGREHHPDNVPYRSQRWLKVASEPLREGDVNFIIGYPGRTNRYATSHDVAFHLETYYPNAIENCEELITLLEEIAAGSEEATIKNAGFIKGLNNRMKNYQGNVTGMHRSNFLEARREAEQGLMTWAEAEPERKAAFKGLMEEFAATHAESVAKAPRDAALGRFRRMAGTLPTTAAKIYWAARQREKPLAERDPDFSAEDLERDVKRLGFKYMTYFEPTDKAVFALTLHKLADLPPEMRVRGLEYIFTDYPSIEDFVDQAYAKTKLADIDLVTTLFSKSVAELDAIDDPLLEMASHLSAEQEQDRLRHETVDARMNTLTRRWVSALEQFKGSELYPDANSTIRLTYGTVKGYAPRDAVFYEPITTLGGVIEKDTGVRPFDVPAKLKQLAAAGDTGRWSDSELGDVPVAFLNDCDITGGNSGSPVLNGKGELVGIAFDGNWEALTGDWQFDPPIQRTISVDIRYVLFITEKLAGATWLLDEMGVQRSDAGR